MDLPIPLTGCQSRQLAKAALKARRKWWQWPKSPTVPPARLAPPRSHEFPDEISLLGTRAMGSIPPAMPTAHPSVHSHICGTSTLSISSCTI